MGNKVQNKLSSLFIGFMTGLSTPLMIGSFMLKENLIWVASDAYMALAFFYLTASYAFRDKKVKKS